MSRRHSAPARASNADARAIESERAVLGALMLDPSAIRKIDGAVRSSDFTVVAHALVFDAITAVAASSTTPDAVTVRDYLAAAKRLEAVGGAEYLQQLVEEVPSAANVAAYAKLVRDHARMRAVRAVGTELQAADGTDPDSIILAAQRQLLSLVDRTERSLRTVGLADFLRLELPKRSDLLAPWLPRQGLVMVHARRGAGKTHFVLGTGFAICSGGEFLRWRAPEPAGVLYVDGEMPAATVQERLAGLVKTAGKPPAAPFDLITPDLQPSGMPDLSSIEGQQLIDACVRPDHALIIIDNLSALCRAGKENEAESWALVQEWALAHRREGRSILFVHHSGKSGLQRGTSRREDVLDTVIQLRQPMGYEQSDGARFEVVFEKARGLVGRDVETFEAQLIPDPDDDRRSVWSVRDASREDQIIAMASDGMKHAEIAAELGINRSTVYRQIRKAVEDGRLPENVIKLRPKREE